MLTSRRRHALHVPETEPIYCHCPSATAIDLTLRPPDALIPNSLHFFCPGRDPCNIAHKRSHQSANTMTDAVPTLPFPVSYMGSKKWLAPYIEDFLGTHRPSGPLLDLFAGMGAIPAAASAHGQVLAADIDAFPALVNYCHLSATAPAPWSYIEHELMPRFHSHMEQTTHSFRELLAVEDDAYCTESTATCTSLRHTLSDLRHSDHTAGLYFTCTYAGSYFGLRQCLQIDALRQAITDCWGRFEQLPDSGKWALLALASAASQCATSPGHFAQPLKPTENNIKRFARERRMSVNDRFIAAYNGLRPCRDQDWRRRNIVWHGEATDVIASKQCHRARPAFVFCDPPYTKDQYSRYYGFYESLIRDDHAPVTGDGRCRALNFRNSSAFCRKRDVEQAFRRLIDRISATGAGAIIAYRHEAILPRSYDIISEMLRARYSRVELLYNDTNARSTMGGAHGTSVITGDDFVLAAW